MERQVQLLWEKGLKLKPTPDGPMVVPMSPLEKQVLLLWERGHSLAQTPSGPVIVPSARAEHDGGGGLFPEGFRESVHATAPGRGGRALARAAAADHVAEGWRRDDEYAAGVAAAGAFGAAVVGALRLSGLRLGAEGGSLRAGPEGLVTPGLAAALAAAEGWLLDELEAEAVPGE